MLAFNSMIGDYLRSLRSWRVWLHLGVQDFRGRYRKALLGPGWLVVTLGLWAVGVGLIYGNLFQQRMDYFLPFLLIGFALWGFLTSSLVDGGTAFIVAEGYIKQFTYPKQIYVLRCLVTTTIPLLVGIGVFLCVAFLYDRPLGFGTLWFALGLLILAPISIAHISIMAHASVGFRDLPHAVAGGLQVLFFVTPVMFTPDMLRARGLDFVYLYNPFYYLIEIIRFPLLENAAAPIEVYLVAVVYLCVVQAVAVIVEILLSNRIVYLL